LTNARTAFAAHRYNEGFRRLGAHPWLIEPVEQLLGGPVYMHQFKVNAKAAFDGAVWQWHQDYGTWQRDDEMPEPRAINIAVFIDDVTAANGPLLFIPGSHKLGVVEAGHDLETTSYPLWTLRRSIAPSPTCRSVTSITTSGLSNARNGLRIVTSRRSVHSTTTACRNLPGPDRRPLWQTRPNARTSPRRQRDFGSMFLSQVPSAPGLSVVSIADLDPERARRACRKVGWSDALVDRTAFVDDAGSMIRAGDLEVVVEATGNPAAGLRHAREAIANGLHIVMVNVEADVLAGPLLAREARQAGVVYSMAYGDQPALTCELVEWARTTGFEVVAAGKGTKYLPAFHASTPDVVWDYYGLTTKQAAAAGMNSQMFNSFVATAERDLQMGDRLDGEGGYIVWGKLYPAEKSLALGGLPIGLAHDTTLNRNVRAGESILWSDVDIDASLKAVRIRREMEAAASA